MGTTPMSFVYDEVGNRTSRTDYNGHTTNYAYDNLNRLTGISYPSATARNATYVYDDVSRLTSAINQNGTVAFSYDNRGRLESETDVWGHVMGHSYDPAGNRLGLTLDSNPHSTYDYDDANRLTSLTDEENGIFNFEYDGINRLTSVVRPNAVSSTFEYDGMSRLTRLTHQYGLLFDDLLTYNAANQIHQIKPLGAAKRIYGYDNLNRLTSVSFGGSESYTYDEVGNRTSSHLSTSYTTGAFNRLTGTTSATASYSYNNNGSMTSKTVNSATTNYTWDRENRLTQAARGTQKSIFKYDALGRRVSSGPSSALLTKFTYDGLDVIMDDGPAVDQLTHYQNGPGIDNKLKSATDGTASYFLQDHLGSTMKLTDSNGSVTESNGYDSFGKPTNSSFSSRYQFTGREYDSFSGLQYSRARFYDPQIGRFISEDPIGFAGGDVNLYGYVWNSPQNYRDPSGLWPYKLPVNPGPNGSNLPEGWTKLPEHVDPNNPGTERWVSPNGDKGLEFHPDNGRQPDHWHELTPKPGRPGRWAKGDPHLDPGDEVDLCDAYDPGRVPNSEFPAYEPGIPVSPSPAFHDPLGLPAWSYPPVQIPNPAGGRPIYVSPAAAATAGYYIVIAGGILVWVAVS